MLSYLAAPDCDLKEFQALEFKMITKETMEKLIFARHKLWVKLMDNKREVRQYSKLGRIPNGQLRETMKYNFY